MFYCLCSSWWHTGRGTPGGGRHPHTGPDDLFFKVFIVCVPVGGIPVKEHFEVNVAPIQIQMTYQLYKAVMQFFFPDKNIETDDGELGSI